MLVICVLSPTNEYAWIKTYVSAITVVAFNCQRARLISVSVHVGLGLQCTTLTQLRELCRFHYWPLPRSEASIWFEIWGRGFGVTGQSIPPAGLYPGLKQPRLDYTQVYYGLGQFIPPQAKLYTHDINHDINSVERYTQELFNFSTSYWGFNFNLSGKLGLSENWNLKTLKLTIKFLFHG